MEHQVGFDGGLHPGAGIDQSSFVLSPLPKRLCNSSPFLSQTSPTSLAALPSLLLRYGRYHDGPQKCIEGTDTAGNPIFSGEKVPFGNCSGALEVYYTSGTAYYQSYQTSVSQPLYVATKDDENTTLLDDVHESLMSFHKDKFAEIGIDTATVEKPLSVIVSNWVPQAVTTPGIGKLGHIPGYTSNEISATVRRPTDDYDIFVANQDYGYRSGWAVGSLTMAEKVLQAELGLAKPTWLDPVWYAENVLAVP